MIRSSVCEEDQFEMFPNPVNKHLNIVLERKTQEIMFYELWTASGKKICYEELTGTIDVSKLDQGVYLLKVYANQKVYIKKFIRQ